jgi:hypothetical protein
MIAAPADRLKSYCHPRHGSYDAARRLSDGNEEPAMNMARSLMMAGALSIGSFPSAAASLNSMNEVGGALLACWTPPANSDNSSVTLSFSFKRDGTLIGPPRATAIRVNGDDKARKAYVDAATKALNDCLPLSFSPSLAQGVAGNVFTMQFNSPKK